MIIKIKKVIRTLLENSNTIKNTQRELLLQTKELEWAHVFHDSIRGKIWLEKLPLNIGRWAGNYSFFYVLHRILSDYKPKKILDLGLGESSKFISTYLDNYLLNSQHTIVEHDQSWINSFVNNFKLSLGSNIVHCPLFEIEINGFKSNSYFEFNNKINNKFDLYIIDGPFGSDRYSRYDIVSLVNRFSQTDEFIILMDDTNREGERDTVNDISILLKSKNIPIFSVEYIGNKTVTLIVSEKYRYATSM